MELRHLRYFVAVAEEMSVTRAAARLGIAQPALSHQIQNLEREVGAALLRRLSRGVALTEAGRRFADEARAILDDVAAAVISARRAAKGELGVVRIGFTGSASFNPFVTGAIRDYRAAFPDVEVELVEDPTASLLPALFAGRLDIAFLRALPGEIDGLWSRHLFDEPMVVAVPVAHPLAMRGSVRLTELAEEAFILYPRRNGRALYDAIVSACEAAGFAPNVLQSAPQLTSVVNLVATGIALSVVPASMGRAATEGVRYLQIDPPGPVAPLLLVRRPAPDAPPALAFCEMALSRLPNLPRAEDAEAE